MTRQCLEIASECQQPISIITKNALVLRDLDLLQSMAARQLVHVNLSITTLDAELARNMEPRTSIPEARLRAVRILADAGIPVRVMVAPLIPGLNDHEAPAILERARDAGASDARYILLRLPLTVAPVFQEWLERTQPLKAEKVLSLVTQTRGGKLNDSSFGSRMVGSGEIAIQIRNLFSIFRRKYDYGELPGLKCDAFKPTTPPGGQLMLF